MGYVDEVLESLKKKNASEPEFLQAATEVLESLRPVIDANEELYRKEAHPRCERRTFRAGISRALPK